VKGEVKAYLYLRVFSPIPSFDFPIFLTSLP
jgi:hypothetical protein